MKRAIAIIRAMTVEGRHHQNCFADQSVQREGYKLQQRARRIARRLGWKLEAVL